MQNSTFKTKLIAVAAATLVLSGVATVAASSAQAAQSPHYTLHSSRAYDYADSQFKIRHYDQTTSGLRWANIAYPTQWSDQGMCWAGITSYGISYWRISG
jgi:hypothetical protein